MDEPHGRSTGGCGPGERALLLRVAELEARLAALESDASRLARVEVAADREARLLQAIAASSGGNAGPDPGAEPPAGRELLLLRAAIEAAGEAIFMTDRDGLFTYVNPAFERLYGHPARALVGRQTPRVIKSGLLGPERYQAFWQAITSNQVVKAELPNRSADGRLIEVEASVSAVLDARQEIVGFLAIHGDITARKSAAAELLQLATVVEQASEAVVILDAERRIRYVNPAFVRATGFSKLEALGELLFELAPPAPDRALCHAISAALDRGQTWTGRLACGRKSGTTYEAEVSFSPIRDAAGVRTACAVVSRDVTRELALQAQLTQAGKMEAVGQLAGGVAHDFNNLLAVILSASSFLLEDDRFAGTAREDLTDIQKAASRAAALTRQLLTFSRRQAVQPEVLDLNGIVANLEKLLLRTLGEQVNLVSVPAPGLWPVKADPGQLEQVVMNLTINSRDAMPGGGRVRIQTANVEVEAGRSPTGVVLAPGRYVALSVADNGPGMTAEVAGRAFDPFFSTKPKGKGTGLGLAIVYGAVTRAGGQIALHTAPAQGATFVIYLPVTDEEPLPLAAPGAAPSVSGRGETVLLVEDEDAVRAVAHRVLLRGGYQVLDARNGGEAVLLFERHGALIDLLLTDVVMPQLSGPELATRLCLGKPGLRVLYMSGFTDAPELPAMLERGGRLLQKPFTHEALLAAVRELLDRSERTA